MTMHYNMVTQVPKNEMEGIVQKVFTSSKFLYPILRKQYPKEYWMLTSVDQCTETNATHYFCCPQGISLEMVNDITREALAKLQELAQHSKPRTIFQKEQKEMFMAWSNELMQRIPE